MTARDGAVKLCQTPNPFYFHAAVEVTLYLTNRFGKWQVGNAA